MKLALATKLVAQVSVLALLSACMADRTPQTEDALLRKKITNLLESSASEVADSRRKLARVQFAGSNTTSSIPDSTPMPMELENAISFEWSGPAADAAKKLARKINYGFKVTGNPPSIPPIVHVLVENASIAKIFEQIGIQAYPVSELVVDPNRRLVEFRYIQAQSGTVIE